MVVSMKWLYLLLFIRKPERQDKGQKTGKQYREKTGSVLSRYNRDFTNNYIKTKGYIKGALDHLQVCEGGVSGWSQEESKWRLPRGEETT